MKKLLVLATAAFLVSGVSYAGGGGKEKGKDKGKKSCTKTCAGKECCKKKDKKA